MRRSIILTLGAVLLAAPFVCGQGFPLINLTIRGNEEIPTERILAIAGLKVGQPVTEKDFNAARDRLLDTGAFESIGFEYKPSADGGGYDATFEVIEVAPLYAYRFEDLGKIDAVLREVLRQQETIFGDRIPATPQVLNRYDAALAKFLGDGAEVKGGLNADLPGELMIVFRPPGRRANVSAVYFKGNVVVPTPELMAIMSRVAVGVPYSEPLFRQMLEQSLAPVYEERGRIRLAFPDIQTRRSEENEGIEITVTLDEGATYTLGKVSLAGVTRSREEELAKEAAFPTGSVANFTEIKEGIKRIERRYRAGGYLRVATKVDREIDDAAHIVNLTVDIDPGAQYSMGELTIKGLDILSEPEIRKVWGLPQGAPYNDTYPDAFVQRIMTEGWFDNLARTGAEAEIHDDTRTVDVTLTFQGGQLVPQNQRQPGQR